MVEHPFGMGPSASYYLMQQSGLTEEQREKLEWLKPILGEEAYTHRVRILSKQHSLGSEESFHIYFLSAFGVAGIFIYLRIARAMFVDLKRLFKGELTSSHVPILSGAMGLFTYGSSISLHFAIFFVTLLYFCFFASRSAVNDAFASNLVR